MLERNEEERSMTALEQFDKALESLLGTKAPGVSGSKVQELTKLAVQNVKVRQTLSISQG